MGKDLKGKELGVGISQEKSGFYVARFTDKFGKRICKRFSKLSECRQWYAETTYNDKHTDLRNLKELTVDAWFETWFEMKQKATKEGTCSVYKNRYNKNIKPVIGDMLIGEVKPIHCQKIFNTMADEHLSNGTLENARMVLHNIFEMALENDIILANPCRKTIKSNIGEPCNEREALTIEEHKKFLQIIEGNLIENALRFVLQTGIRVAELSGLRWSDVDFENRTIKITQIVYWLDRKIIIGTPKTKSSVRVIPLTDDALRILQDQKEKNKQFKIIPLEWSDYVFLHPKTKKPLIGHEYDGRLTTICKNNNFKHTSMHILRHTFATRCIEAGMKPKTLQKLLGHSNISTTMNLYVHTTEDEKQREMALVSEALLAMAQ